MATINGTVKELQKIKGTVRDKNRISGAVAAILLQGGGLNGDFEDVTLSGRFNETLDLSGKGNKVKLTLSTNDVEIQFFGIGTNETKLLWVHFSTATDGLAIQCAPLGTDGIKYFGEVDLARVVFKQSESDDYLL